MLIIHPRFYKKIKIGFFQRIANGLSVMFMTCWRGLGNIFYSPLAGLNEFCRKEYNILDVEKILEESASGNEIPDYLEDIEEEWKRQHKEQYGDE